MLKKLCIFVAFLLVALVVADFVVGRKIVDGKFHGVAVPPYWEPSEKEVRALTRRLQLARDGRPDKRAFRGWSPRYGWVNAPGKITDKRGEELWINSLGARGRREVAAEPRSGATRVLCFGESFTYCTEVKDGEDWPSRLEAHEDRLEVLNFGVGAWGTDQALLRFREVAPELDHDVAILGIMLENIRRNVNRSRLLYSPADSYALVKPRFIVTEAGLELVPIPYSDEVEYLEAALAGRLFDDLEEHEYWSRIGAFPSFSNLAKIRAARAFEERKGVGYVEMWRDRDSEPYRVTLALLEAFHREALELGARETLVVIFHREQDYKKSGFKEFGTTYWSHLLSDLEERGIPFIDTYEGVAGMRRDGGRGYQVTHHDALANDLIAELVLARLTDRLPELR